MSCIAMDWLSWRIFTFLIVTYACTKACTAGASPREDVRLEALEKMVYKRGPVLSFDQDQYMKFVIEGDRPYDLVMLYSAGDDVDCNQCREAKKYFAAIAQAYYDEGVMQLNQGKIGKHVFFVFMNLRRHPSVSYMHGLTRVPVWVYINRAMKLTGKPNHDSKNGHKVSVPIPESAIMTRLYPGLSRKASALKWVNTQAKLPHIVFRRTPMEIFHSALLILCLLAAGIIIPITLIHIARANPMAMAVGALCMQILACGAVCWCILHGTPWIGKTSSGARMIMHPNRRNQYIVEGLLMSFLTVAGGLFFYAGGLLIRKRRGNSWVQSLLSLTAVLLAFGCYLTVLRVHEKKSGIPSSSFFPPPEYAKGPLRLGRGNSL